MKAQRLAKKEMLAHWAGLEVDGELSPSPIPYKHKGSTFDQDGIRITGRREFIDGVLARLKELLACENTRTRLQVVYQQAVDRNTQEPLDSWTCYIQVHERGDEAKMANALASSLAGKQTIISRGY